MIEFLSASENLPFAVSLAVMLGIAILEGVATLLGAGLSSVFDTLVPDLHLDFDTEMPGGVESPGPTPLSKLLGWLRVGEVPVLILLVLFLTAFGLIGIGVQSVANASLGTFIPSYIAAIPALILALPIVRMSAGIIAVVMPKDETEVVSSNSFIGRIAVITLGQAKQGCPAEAKLVDQFGQTHYIMLVPDVDGEVLEQGKELLIVSKEGPIFKAIQNPNPKLSD